MLGKKKRQFDSVTKNGYTRAVTSKELKRELTALGATFKTGNGSHLKVSLNGKNSVLPMHNKDLPKGTLLAIRKQLGLK
jgi:mRNA interferase HicA